MKKRILPVLLTLALSACICGAAETAEFSLKAALDGEKTILKSGSPVIANVVFGHPPEYEPLYWRAILAYANLPEDFCGKVKVLESKSKDPRWRSVYILKGYFKQSVPGYFPIPYSLRKQNAQKWEFSPENWPEGDYTVTLQLMLRHRDWKTMKDGRKAYRYTSSAINFTLEK